VEYCVSNARFNNIETDFIFLKICNR